MNNHQRPRFQIDLLGNTSGQGKGQQSIPEGVFPFRYIGEWPWNRKIDLGWAKKRGSGKESMHVVGIVPIREKF